MNRKQLAGNASADQASADQASADKASADKASAGRASLLPTLCLPTLLLPTLCLPTVWAAEKQPPEVAGEIFGQPVSIGNYGFAKRVIYTFPSPWGAADSPVEMREAKVWESLILHYEAFRRGIQATDDEVEQMVNDLLRGYELTFTRRGDPEAYRRWVTETLGYDPELLENQVEFLIQIRKLRDQVRQELPEPSVTEEEMQQEFLNETHHLSGEMVVFETREEAQTFYETVKTPKRWEQMKAKGKHQVRPVSMMTLEAYMDLWKIPKDQLYAFHAKEPGSVEPMPFGSKQWCVYRLGEKRTGDLNEFPKQRESYRQQLIGRKRYEALKRWIEQLKASAKLTVSLPDG